MGTYEKLFGASDARALWPVLIRKASDTHHQIRQHSDGTYQVIRGRFHSGKTPVATARTLEAALSRAKK